MSIEATDVANFSASLRSVQIGQLTLSNVCHDNVRYLSKSGVSERFGTDYFYLSFCKRGQAVTSLNNDSETIRAGNIKLGRSNGRKTTQFTDKYVGTQLLIPSKTISNFLPNGPESLLIADGSHTIRASMLNSILQKLVETRLVKEGENETIKFFERNILELLALLVEMEESSAISEETSVCYAHRLRVQRIIKENLDDPDLNPAKIAELSQLSKSYLHRIFYANGHSVMREVKKQRLKKAQQLLQSKRVPKLSVSEVAYACGFVSHVAMCHAFRTDLGMSPKEFRATQRFAEGQVTEVSGLLNVTEN